MYLGNRTNHSSWFIWSVTTVYAVLIIVWSCFHEPWRDEVLPVTLVIKSHSLWDLFHNLKDYGHPALWCTILYVVHHIFPYYGILKIINVSVNVIGAHIFL